MMSEFPARLLEEVMRDCLPSGNGKLSFSRIGTGKYNASYRVDGWERPLVLRVAPEDKPELHLFYEFRMMRQEPGIHAILAERTDVPIPGIVAHRVQHPVLKRDLLIMERLPGEPLSDTPLPAAAVRDVLRQVGRHLREAHSITREEYGYVGEHRPMDPQSSWVGAFAVMWNRLLDDIERCEGYSPGEAAGMRRLLDRHMKVFDRPVKASLLHMDIWSQNILCDREGRLTGLLDWDRGLWGDPEIEFAVLDYCGISEPEFWEGYGRPRDLSPEARMRQVFYFLYELQKYIFIRRVRNGSAAGAERYRRQALMIAGRI